MAKKKSTRKKLEALKLVPDAFEKASALLSRDQAYDLEEKIGKDPFGLTRRIAFVILTQPGQRLIDLIKNNREFAVGHAAVLDNLQEYEKALRELADMIGCAHMRARVALCYREDMKDLYAQAKREGAVSDAIGTVQ